jgi:hypothetical protein
LAAASPSFIAILASLAGGIYVGRSVFPQVDEAQENRRRVELLRQEIPQRANTGYSAKTVGIGLEKVPVILQSWKELVVEGPPPLPPPPATAAPVTENLPNLLAQWQSQPAGPARAAQTMAVSSLWGRIDPLGAQGWMAQLTDATELAAAQQGLANGWSAVEPFAASEWLATIPEGAARTAVVSAFTKAAGPVAPLLALTFALSVEDVAVRTEVASHVLGYAARACPVEAETLLRGADIPSAEMKALVAKLSNLKPEGGQP